MIEEFWKNKRKIKTQEIWKWQVNELIKLKSRYGDLILESQLRESINKGWNSIFDKKIFSINLPILRILYFANCLSNFEKYIN